MVKSSRIAFDPNNHAFPQPAKVRGECLDLRTLPPTVRSRRLMAPVVEGKFVTA